MIRFNLLLAALLVSLLSFAQIKDTVRIDEVQITASAIEYLPGTKTQNFDPQQMAKLNHLNLADAISRYTPLYVKSNAGALSTIHFRGTTSNHTSIMFGDININSLTLGHSNLADVPLFLFDQMTVQYGSSSVLYGSDAIGGTIQLQEDYKWKNHHAILVQQDVASFSDYLTGVKLKLGNQHWNGSVAAFRKSVVNNFEFKNTALLDGPIMETQRDANILNYGLLANLAYQPNTRHRFVTKFWFGDNWHRIQPKMLANHSNSYYEELQNTNHRFALEYTFSHSAGKLLTSANVVRDNQLYNKNESQRIITTRVVSKIENQWNSLLGFKVRLGVKAAYMQPDVYSYIENKAEQRADIYASALRNFDSGWSMAMSLREAFVSNYRSKFTPSFNLSYRIYGSSNGWLKAHASVAESYKTPTFNQRFWPPGGNPNVRPEDAWSGEIGLQGQYMQGLLTLHYQLSGYYMKIKDLIQWVPFNLGSRPENVGRALLQGIESVLNADLDLGELQCRAGLNYSLNHAMDQNKDIPLIYRPKHQVTSFVELQYNHLTWQADGNFTDKRASKASETSPKYLPGYSLFNTQVSYKFKLHRSVELNSSLGVQNIFNKQYQNDADYAMPGRSYRLSLRFVFE